MFITFEGIDGSGKSTQISLLKTYLSTKNIQSHIFREPGGTDISERIRSLLLHDTEEMDPVTELLLFSSARSQLIAEKVIPLLENNETVILDRFYDSTVAYQGYGRQSASLNDIDHLNRIAAHGLVPDLTFYLRLSIENADRRTSSNDKDRMEKSGRAFFDKVSEGFDELSSREKRFKVIDANREKAKVHQEIVNHVESLL
ncbi:dTMP kinase [Rhodohalobacter sp. 8-1]|uniref:dTMP kinase n=1 Tax=Rhodohalobacter sp. 8-1 TaxID=3131972 RepID=UPI0030ED38C2